MTKDEKLNLIKQLGFTPVSTTKPRTHARIKRELTGIIERSTTNNNNFSEDMKIGIFYALLWQFGYDYDEALRLARELLNG